MSAIQFKPYVRVYLQEESSKVILSRPYQESNLGIVYELTLIGVQIFRLIGTGLSVSVIKEMMLQKHADCGDEVDEIFDILFSENYIEEKKEVEAKYLQLEDEYGRLLPIWAEFESDTVSRYQIHENLMKKKIGVIGVGTVGFGVVSKLVTYGIHDFVLVDSDQVELTNLSRQSLFSTEDIGKYKVDCAESFVKSRKSHASIVKVTKNVEQANDLESLRDCDIVVVAGDYPSYIELAYLVQKFCFTHNIPIAFAGGYKAHVGKIYPLVIPYQTACFHCITKFLQESDDLGERIGNKEIKVSSTVQMGDFIANIVSFEIIKYLTGVIEPYLINKILILDLSFYNKTEIVVPRYSDCLHCQEGK